MATYSAILWGIFSGGILILLRTLFVAAMSDVGRRISSTMFGIQAFENTLGRLLRDDVWSGEWEVAWNVKSKAFLQSNKRQSAIARCFNSVALEGVGLTTAGVEIPYGFIGKLSRDKSIVTGTWFDRSGNNAGYHGVYQLRLQGGRDEAVGKWAGFSETGSNIKTGTLYWTKVRSS